MFDLEHLLSPLTVTEFLENYHSEKAVHIAGNADKFPDVYDWEQVNDEINFGRPGREYLRLIYEKKPLEHAELGRLAEWLVKGATLVVNSAQQSDPVLSRFAARLGGDMNAIVNINCYASYPSKQGFDTHADRHDVFIVHTGGKKHWKVYPPTRKHPLDRDPDNREPPPETDPYLECDLEVGDVLYIPRGHWHNAVAVGPSIHLTVSTEQNSGIDFLYWFTNQLRISDEFLRKDFPVVKLDLLGGDQPHDSFLEHVETFRSHMRKLIDDDGLAESFLQFNLLKNRIPRQVKLPELAMISDTITRKTVFRMAPDQKLLVRYEDDKKQGKLVIRGHILDMNNISRSIVDEICRGDTFTGNSLKKGSPTTSWRDIKQMLVFLYEYGILLVDNES